MTESQKRIPIVEVMIVYAFIFWILATGLYLQLVAESCLHMIMIYIAKHVQQYRRSTVINLLPLKEVMEGYYITSC